MASCPLSKQQQNGVNEHTLSNVNNNGEKQPLIIPDEAEQFNPILSRNEKLYFFILGLAPVFAWNCIFVSEAYFEIALGPAVLSRLGLCQNLASLIIQVILLGLRKQFVFYIAPIASACTYMTALSAIFLAVPLSSLQPWHLYILQTTNGLFTGMAQTQLGNLGGLYGNAGQCGALLFAGNSLGALSPPIVQLIALLSHGVKVQSPQEADHNSRMAAQIVFSIGVVGSLLGVIAVMLLSRTKHYKILTSPNSMEQNEDCKTIGANISMAKEEWAQRTVKLSQLYIVLTRGAWLFILAIAPYVVPHDGTNMFWVKNLATFLIVAANFGDFIGRAIANKIEWLLLRMKWLTAAVMARFIFVLLAVLYIHQSWEHNSVIGGGGNVFVIALYFFMSMTHGYLVVSLQTKSQTACGFYPGEDSCPVISQMSWLSSQTGLVVGIAASFIPVS